MGGFTDLTLCCQEAGLSAIGFGGHSHPHPRPPPPSETIDACVEPDDWTEFDPPSEGLHHHRFDVWRRTEFSLPSTSDDIFLFSRGFRSHRGVNGVLHVVEAADRDDIGVEVIVGSLEKSHLFEKVKLCKLHRGDNGHGVGILVSCLRLLCSCSCGFMCGPIGSLGPT